MDPARVAFWRVYRAWMRGVVLDGSLGACRKDVTEPRRVSKRRHGFEGVTVLFWMSKVP